MNHLFSKPLRLWILPVLCLLLITGCQETAENTEQDSSYSNDVSQNTNSQSNEKQATQTETANLKSSESSKEKKGKTFTAKVVRTIDGDTVKIKMPNGKEETVRLLLIDTPETVHPSKPVQPFGPEASKYAKELMPAGSKVEVEPGISERDKYGRLLAYFYVDGKMVNKLLLEKGLARVAYVYAPNTKYIDEFEAIQKKAQSKAIGIWSVEDYVTSRGFDDSKTSKKTETNTKSNAACSNPDIKGNINSKGQKIYHVPDGKFYDITKPEEMFCTEQDALQAGFRKSQQ